MENPSLATTTVRRVIEVMGTVVSVHVRQIARPFEDVAAALDALEDWLHWVDTTFSTYQADSQINRLDRGELGLEDCHPYVHTVLQACTDAHAATEGYFTADLNGHIDPTGLVKGWAAQKASALLSEAGLPHHAISAGGDVVCAGERAPGQAWRTGISDPHRPGMLLTVVQLSDSGVATSGTTERGAHVLDPHTGRPARALASVSVVGPDLAVADAYATAALATGSSRPPWLDQISGYEALTVTADGHITWTPGFPAFTPPAAGSRAQFGWLGHPRDL